MGGRGKVLEQIRKKPVIRKNRGMRTLILNFFLHILKVPIEGVEIRIYKQEKIHLRMTNKTITKLI